MSTYYSIVNVYNKVGVIPLNDVSQHGVSHCAPKGDLHIKVPRYHSEHVRRVLHSQIGFRAVEADARNDRVQAVAYAFGEMW